MKTVEGWIFDVYLSGRDMAVWVLDRDGRAHCLRDSFIPAFYLGGAPKDLDAAVQSLIDQHWDIKISRAERIHPDLGSTVVVLQVEVMNPNHFLTIFERTRQFTPKLAHYDGHLSVAQMYFLMRQAFPLAFCHFVIDEENRILVMETQDFAWSIGYELPSLRRMSLRLRQQTPSADDGHDITVIIQTANGSRTFSLNHPRPFLRTLRSCLIEYDPDVIETECGDSFVFPLLGHLVKVFNIAIPFNRDPKRPPQFSKVLSRHSDDYLAFTPVAQTLFGRWHIDLANSFLHGNFNVQSILEVTHLTRMPVQNSLRLDQHAIVDAVENAMAWRRGMLISIDKKKPASDTVSSIGACQQILIAR